MAVKCDYFGHQVKAYVTYCVACQHSCVTVKYDVHCAYVIYVVNNSQEWWCGFLVF